MMDKLDKCGPLNNRIRFERDLFTGTLGVQVMCTYGPDIPEYDHWAWSDDVARNLRLIQKKHSGRTTLRPKLYNIAPVH